jgi:hypothetical protein
MRLLGAIPACKLQTAVKAVFRFFPFFKKGLAIRPL